MPDSRNSTEPEGRGVEEGYFARGRPSCVGERGTDWIVDRQSGAPAFANWFNSVRNSYPTLDSLLKRLIATKMNSLLERLDRFGRERLGALAALAKAIST